MTGGLPASAWDLVVVGAGAAGTAAAIEAGERGLRVLVLEGYSEYGGAARLSGAGCCIAGSPLQRSLGIDDSVELAFADWVRAGGPAVDQAWARFYLEHAVEDLYLWAEQRGVRWAAVRRTPGNSVARWHHPASGGPELMAALYAHAQTLPVVWRFNALVTGLIVEGGAVRGVHVGSESIRARAVLLATGGFSNDPAMLAQNLPPLADGGRYLRGGAPQAVGVGHGLLRSVGAEFTALDAICLYPIGTPHPDDPTDTRGVSIIGITSVWLNRKGLRFHNEAHRDMADTPALVAQPGSTSWCVFDRDELDKVVIGADPYYKSGYVPGLDVRERVRDFISRSRFAWRADTLEDLARGAGLPAAESVASVRRFNELIGAGAPVDDFGRDLRGLRPIDRPPFYALRFFPWVQKCLGGARTDLRCRVLRSDGSVIDGVYAAGELAGMAGGHINGYGSIEGTMIAPSLFAGRVAARTIAAERP